MPGPDPHRFWIEDDRPGSARVCWQAYDYTGNNGNRRKRANAILRRLAHGDWYCRWCYAVLPDHLRADALYCGNQCRKRMARARREARRKPSWDGWPLT